MMGIGTSFVGSLEFGGRDMIQVGRDRFASRVKVKRSVFNTLADTPSSSLFHKGVYVAHSYIDLKAYIKRFGKSSVSLGQKSNKSQESMSGEPSLESMSVFYKAVMISWVP